MAHKTYIRHTDGDTAVLFIHGFLGSTEHFEQFIPSVPKNCAIYNILLQGHGGSALEFGRASMRKWKAQVDDAVCKLTERYSDIIIMAHSMGTFFAMDAALKYPKSVKALVLLQSPLKIAVRSYAFVNTIKSLFNLIPENDEAGLAYRRSHSVRLTLRIWEYIGWIPRYLELFREARRARTVITKIGHPCYIFQSKNDELVSMKSMRFIPNKPNIRTEVLPASAHFIYSDGDYLRINSVFEPLFGQSDMQA